MTCASIQPRIVPNSPCKVASISPRFGPGRSVIFSTSARIASAASLRSSGLLSASVSRSTFFRYSHNFGELSRQAELDHTREKFVGCGG